MWPLRRTYPVELLTSWGDLHVAVEHVVIGGMSALMC